MKVLKITALIATLAGVTGLAIALAPSVFAQSRGRELTILGGRGSELGVSIVDGKAGVEIDDVHANSPAERAGLKRGDVFVEFDGEHVRSSRQFARLVQETPAGKSVKATISRDGKKQDVELTVADSRDSRVILGGDGRFLTGDFPRRFFDTDQFRESMREFADRLPEIERGFRDLPTGGRLGVNVTELSSQLADYFGAKDGVLVTSVTDGSAAAKAGIKAGDVITSINGERITSSADLVQSLRRAETEDVSIGIVRDKKEQTVRAKVEPRRPLRGARPA